MAAHHDQPEFVNEAEVRATVHSWIDRVAGEITDPMIASYREIAGPQLVEFVGSHLQTFADYTKALDFIGRYPDSPLGIQLHALLMVRAVEAGDAPEASRHLKAVNFLLERFGIQYEALRFNLAKCDALIALMTLDYERFDAAIGSLVLPMDSLLRETGQLRAPPVASQGAPS